MNASPKVDRFVVLRRDPGVWVVLDQYRCIIEVVVFPADEVTAAHVRWFVTTQAVEHATAGSELLDMVARRATQQLAQAGYTVHAPH